MVMVRRKYHAPDVGKVARFRLVGYSFRGGMLASVGALFAATDDANEFFTNSKGGIVIIRHVLF